MLDNKTQQMLNVACLLTADDLDEIRNGAVASFKSVPTQSDAQETSSPEDLVEESSEPVENPTTDSGLSRGERERQRTRASKISTACVGQPREPHQWWPIGTELVGRIGRETFLANVVENPRVKSGRSILITSGAAKGTTCITPTRAAIEATEAFRQTRNLGRGGGVTNGWTFWKARP